MCFKERPTKRRVGAGPERWSTVIETDLLTQQLTSKLVAHPTSMNALHV
jgi:hypothetical protein